MKKLLRKLRVVKIDALVYSMKAQDALNLPSIGYEISTEQIPGKTAFTIVDNGKVAHRSFLFAKVHLLKLLAKSGPVIGDCYTNPDYRGRSIYPKVINSIAKEQLEQGIPEVFIIVSPDNSSSIRGIEKAGFKLIARVRAKRFAVFYFDKHIERFDQ